jgi:hypothetical protein
MKLFSFLLVNIYSAVFLFIFQAVRLANLEQEIDDLYRRIE